mgnify:CR=1 FL=1
MPYFVYILANIKNDKILTYVGYTSDLKNRIKLHNSSRGARFTKGKKWILVFKKKYNNKIIAMKEEYRIKKNKVFRKKIRLRIKKNILNRI